MESPRIKVPEGDSPEELAELFHSLEEVFRTLGDRFKTEATICQIQALAMRSADSLVVKNTSKCDIDVYINSSWLMLVCVGTTNSRTLNGFAGLKDHDTCSVKVCKKGSPLTSAQPVGSSFEYRSNFGQSVSYSVSATATTTNPCATFSGTGPS